MAKRNIFVFVLFVVLYSSISFGYETNYQDVYTWDNALQFLMYSYASYCEGPALQAWNCYWCTFNNTIETVEVSYVFSNGTTDSFGYAGITSDMVLFSFRGTVVTDLKNWISDLESAVGVPYKNVPNAEVAFGFYEAYLDVEQQVINAAETLTSTYPNLPVVFVGHSLGAALTILAALDIAEQLNLDASNLYVWNFGDPRVGNDVFHSYFQTKIGNTFRSVNQADIVPHVPPQLLGFHHVATEVWYPNNVYDFQICDGSGEDPNCSDSVVLPLSIDNHLEYLGFDQRWGIPEGC